jgi:hypothetical protein
VGPAFIILCRKTSPPNVSDSPASLFAATDFDKLAGQKNARVMQKLRIACFPELFTHLLFQITRNFSQTNIF